MIDSIEGNSLQEKLYNPDEGAMFTKELYKEPRSVRKTVLDTYHWQTRFKEGTIRYRKKEARSHTTPLSTAANDTYTHTNYAGETDVNQKQHEG